jgi:prepilin-type N-terminal cleavage/methylation domain-containing protein
MCRSGLTLVELMAVLVITTVLMGLVSVRWLGSWQSAVLASDVDKLRSFDHLARKRAIETAEHLQLVIAAGSSRVSLRMISSGEVVRAIQLSRGIEASHVPYSGDVHSPRHSDIRYRPDGSSPTYALELASSDGQKRWLAFAGRTGQCSLITNKEQLDDWFGALAAQGIHPD